MGTNKRRDTFFKDSVFPRCQFSPRIICRFNTVSVKVPTSWFWNIYSQGLFLKYLFIYCLRFYLFETVRELEQGEGQREREKQTPHWAGSPMCGLIPGPQDHDLTWRQQVNQLSHPGAPIVKDSLGTKWGGRLCATGYQNIQKPQTVRWCGIGLGKNKKEQ